MKKRMLTVLLGICVFTFAMTACSKKEAAAPKDEVNTEEDTSSDDGQKSEENVTETALENRSLPAVITAHYYASLYDEYYNEDGSYNDDYIGTLAEISCEYPYVISEGYENLNAALKAYSDRAVKETISTRLEIEKEITEARGTETYAWLNLPWADETSIGILRADDRVFSFWQNLFFNMGGAHPSYDSVGFNFDAVTGEKIELSDAAVDYDGIYEYVLNYLDTFEYHEGLFPDYQDTIRKCFYPQDELYSVNWAFTAEGLSVMLNPYLVGPFAMGQVEIVIPDDELDKYIDAKYLPAQEATVWPIYQYRSKMFDVDGDGVDEELYIAAEEKWDEEYQYSMGFVMNVTLGKPENPITVFNEGEIEFDSAYLMKNEEGKYYLYVQVMGDNDWNYLMIYDLNDPEGPRLIEDPVAGSFYSFAPVRADEFYLSYRLEALGTRQGFRRYKLGADGLPEALDEEYTIEKYDYPNYYEDFDPTAEEYQFPLTALIDVKCIDGEIKAGERVAVVKVAVDEGNYPLYAVLKKQSGEIVTVAFGEKDPEMWERKIGDKPESEVFDGIIYAG